MEMKKREGKVLSVAMITAFITTFMGSALNLSVPAMEKEFQSGSTMVGWIIIIYSLTVSAAGIPMGKAADRKGMRKIFLTGIGGFCVTSLLSACSWNIWVMIFFRCLQGISAAMIFATNNAILISSYPLSRQGEMLGYSTAATYIGLSAGPVAGGFLNHYLGWRSVFICSAAVAAFAFIHAYINVEKDIPDSDRKEKDGYGILLYVLMIVAGLYGLTELTSSLWGKYFLAAGVTAGIIFVIHEMRTDNPVLDLKLFTGNRNFTLANVSALLNYGATYAISYMISLYLQLVMGYPSDRAGLILICMPAVQALFSPVMGRLSDKVNPEKLATAGMIMCTVTLFMFSVIEEDTSFIYIMTGLVTAGFGFALFSSPNTNSIMKCVKKDEYGIANSIIATMRNCGQTASMSVVSIFMSVYIGNTAMESVKPALFIHTADTVFMVFTLLCATAAVLSAVRMKKSGNS